MTKDVKGNKPDTKPVGNGEVNIISAGESKIFRYTAGVDSIVDGNVVSMAFLREYKGDKKSALEYTWFTKDGNTLKKRGLFVQGHVQLGVPTLREYDVYVALQRIFINKKTKNGICELKAKDYNNDYLKIDFSISELATELGYNKSVCKTTKDNIIKSIKILLATSIESLYDGGIYDITNKKYIKNTVTGFHLIESVNSDYITDEEGTVVYDATSIKLSEFTYKQILNDYKLFYNKETYNKTKNLMAKKIYHMALQWKGKNNIAFANINTLMERIPMVDVQDKYKKRDIKKALKILNDKDMVKIEYDKDNPEKVYFIFKQDTCTNYFLDKYNSFAEIEKAYYNMGFDFIEMSEWLDVENIRTIQAILRYMDFRTKTGSITNPKEYFKGCLKNPKFKIDERFFTKE